MNLILIFVVLPLATIIFSIALQRLLKCPILVSAIVFAVFLILTYTVFGTDFIIAAIVYALLAFITAFITSLICGILRRLRRLEGRNSDCDCDDDCGCHDDYGCSRSGESRVNGNSRRNRRCKCNSEDNNSDDNLLTISSRCGNGETSELLTISTGGTFGNNNNSCNSNNANNNCNCNNNNERIIFNAEVLPNNNGNSGAFRGCFRRRWN